MPHNRELKTTPQPALRGKQLIMGMNLHAILNRKKNFLEKIQKEISLMSSEAYLFWSKNPYVRNKMDYETYLVTEVSSISALYQEADKICKEIRKYET